MQFARITFLFVLLIAIPPQLQASFICGADVNCLWDLDMETRGTFILSHAVPVDKTHYPLQGLNHTFISPSGFWEVQFDSISEQDGPGFPKFPLDEVTVTGFMQHIRRPSGLDHATDPDMGQPFPFELNIVEFAGPLDMKMGTENHGHTDTYLVLLAGKDATPPAQGFLFYNFGVKGMHTEIFESPTDMPEPAT